MYTGKVVIAGAGPGDPELLTLKTARYLHEADVVLTDRLVSRRILELYVNPIAEVIFAGKEGGKDKSTPQKKINRLLVKYAQEGKLVVRLKGGDISVFSNILDELETLIAHGIPYELVPGITAAAGAAAYAGIPLTARGHARGVRYITFGKKEQHTGAYWKDLAGTDDTLVFYMAGDSFPDVVENLLQQHIDPAKGIAVVQQATTPYQRVFTYSFEMLKQGIISPSFVSPTLLIVGHVTKLHKRFSWVHNSREQRNYFSPVAPSALTMAEATVTA